ncbi:MAG: nitrophenyl compound nitroreductase subunit ArsF family protein [Paludibacteraceae bacterium]
MKKQVFVWAAVVTVSLLSACGSKPAQTSEQTAQSMVETRRAPIEILYFHGKQRCVTCRAIEQVLEELTQDGLREAIASGRVHYRAVDITEEPRLAERYEVAWSSLVIDCNGEVTNLTEQAFACARRQPDKLKEEIMRLCNGYKRY